MDRQDSCADSDTDHPVGMQPDPDQDKIENPDWKAPVAEVGKLSKLFGNMIHTM
jgi:hypothetical protein